MLRLTLKKNPHLRILLIDLQREEGGGRGGDRQTDINQLPPVRTPLGIELTT